MKTLLAIALLVIVGCNTNDVSYTQSHADVYKAAQDSLTWQVEPRVPHYPTLEKSVVVKITPFDTSYTTDSLTIRIATNGKLATVKGYFDAPYSDGSVGREYYVATVTKRYDGWRFLQVQFGKR